MPKRALNQTPAQEEQFRLVFFELACLGVRKYDDAVAKIVIK